MKQAVGCEKQIRERRFVTSFLSTSTVLARGESSRGALLLVGVLTALGVSLAIGAGQNVGLTLLAFLILALGVGLLWRPGESPILLYIFSYQWLQATASIFHSNVLSTPLSDYSGFGGDAETAIFLSLIGLACLAFGMRLGAGPWSPAPARAIAATATAHPPSAWFALYAGAVVVAVLAATLAYVAPGLTQPLLALASLKWAFFWMLAFATLLRPLHGRFYLVAAFAFELALGLGSYFSDFKTVFMFAIMAVVASGVRLSARLAAGLAVLSALVLSLALFWTAIKTEYRIFVSGGQAQQVVKVSYPERMAKLVDLVSDLDARRLEEAADKLVRRLSYVEFFGLVVNYVPEIRAHENGAIWRDALMRPITPRLLNPNKEAIDDSVRTMRYTGRRVAGEADGTSISIGYMGEAYIDFGAIGMMAPIFALGLLIGRIYRWMLVSPRAGGVLGMGMASAVLFGLSALETSITKSFGGLVVAFVMAWLVLRFVAPRAFAWARAAS